MILQAVVIIFAVFNQMEIFFFHVYTEIFRIQIQITVKCESKVISQIQVKKSNRRQSLKGKATKYRVSKFTKRKTPFNKLGLVTRKM